MFENGDAVAEPRRAVDYTLEPAAGVSVDASFYGGGVTGCTQHQSSGRVVTDDLRIEEGKK